MSAIDIWDANELTKVSESLLVRGEARGSSQHPALPTSQKREGYLRLTMPAHPQLPLLHKHPALRPRQRLR